MCDLEYITQPILGPAETGTVCPISAPHVKPGAGQGVVERTAWDGPLHGLPGDQVGHLHLIRLTFKYFPFYRKSIDGAFTTVRCLVLHEICSVALLFSAY